MSKHNSWMDEDRPAWYGELSHPPFRTFGDLEMNEVLSGLSVAKGKRGNTRARTRGIVAVLYERTISGWISNRIGSVGSMTVIQYGLVYSRLFDSYPPNSKLIDIDSGQILNEQINISPDKHMRFQLYTTEGEPGIIEDHYYFMQALVTYDFAFRSDRVDERTADQITGSFVYYGKPSNPCGEAAICDITTEPATPVP